MRALSFKTGIACLCGTEVKEKFQCESLVSLPHNLVRINLGKTGVVLFPGLHLLCPGRAKKQLSCSD